MFLQSAGRSASGPNCAGAVDARNWSRASISNGTVAWQKVSRAGELAGVLKRSHKQEEVAGHW